MQHLKLENLEPKLHRVSWEHERLQRYLHVNTYLYVNKVIFVHNIYIKLPHIAQVAPGSTGTLFPSPASLEIGEKSYITVSISK